MKRGEVYRFNLDPTIGSEIRTSRLCVVVMHDPQGRSPVTIVCPVTAASGRPGNLLNPALPAGVAGAAKDSRIACHQIRTLDKRRAIGAKAGVVPPEIMALVSAGLRAILGL